MRLTDKTISNMAIAKVFKDYVVFSKKYGVDLVRFTHAPNAIICASKNNWDESLRYLSLHDNRYLRYFKGHRDKVVSLAMSPVNDTFLSASLDETVRLWDLRTNVCQGLLRTRGGRSAVAFDPQGLIFACATSNNALKLYDCRSFDKGPFGSFQVAYPHVLEWTHLKFSPDGKLVLLAASENLVFLADSFTGQVLQTFSSHVNETGCVLEASFTPDSQYVFSGSEDGAIHVWRTAGPAEPVHVFHAHAAPVGCVAWNPKYAMFASACTNLCMWLPQEELPTA